MKCILSFLAVCVLALLCGGCFLQFDDVSDEPQYAAVLNSNYVLKTNMLVQGINMDSGYGSKIHFYSLKPFSQRVVGPEIITNITFYSGQTVEVAGIRRSSTAPLFEKKLVQAVLHSSLELQAGCPLVAELKYILETNYFEKLNKKQNAPTNSVDRANL